MRFTRVKQLYTATWTRTPGDIVTLSVMLMTVMNIITVIVTVVNMTNMIIVPMIITIVYKGRFEPPIYAEIPHLRVG